MSRDRRVRISPAARLAWEYLDVRGTIEEVVAAVASKPDDEIQVRRMLPRRVLRSVWCVHRGQLVGFVVRVDAGGAWVEVAGVMLDR